MWLAGWAARRQPATTKAMDLFAKALVLEDARGERVVIVTADLIAIPRSLANAVAARVQQQWSLPRERLLFNASHTHTGPEIRPDKVPFFEIPPEFAAKIGPYLARIEEEITGVINEALGRLEAVTLLAFRGHAAFAHNRRASTGPTDHDVPAVMVNRHDGKPVAVLFGYACHNLTLPPAFLAYHGDYAGVAQSRLEQKFPGVIALFLAGAGADQDPAPRGNLELTQAHGVALADAVQSAGSAEEVSATLGVAFEDVTLDLLPVPAAETLQADLRSDDVPRRRKAAFLLDALAAKQPLATSLDCPVQVIRLGDELLLIALGGEPVVDYALRLKSELAGRLVCVAGYSNDMFGYLPTRRVQEDGGYEGGRAALWSALPAAVAESSEERVLAAVRRLAAELDLDS